MVEASEESYLKNIEWNMMDKSKFFPLSMMSHFCVRGTLYPLTLIKTRLQLQRHDQMYKGLVDALSKIYRSEGLSGLYRGFWVNSIQIASGVCYIGTYESVRHLTASYFSHPQARTIIAGAAASIVNQTIIIPIDVISQHLMLLGLSERHSTTKKMVLYPLGFTIDPAKSKFQTAVDIGQYIYYQDGVLGFYRGYIASMCTYVPNHAIWWVVYHMYQDKLRSILPENFSLLVIQCMAATLGGFTTTIITNPMDTIRARLQVQRKSTILSTFRSLWIEDGVHMFTKGLSARLVQSVMFSFSIILGYETIKRISVKEEYKERIRW